MVGSCRCHRLGSWTESCDGGQCECRPGVGGQRCDRCEPGYWGLHKIASDGNLGCLRKFHIFLSEITQAMLLNNQDLLEFLN